MEGAVKRRKQARRHGSSHEQWVADFFPNGYVYNGTAGDVVVDDWIIECKYRLRFRAMRRDDFRGWINQAKRNARDWKKRKKEMRWAVCFTGGGLMGRYMVLSPESFTQLSGVTIPTSLLGDGHAQGWLFFRQWRTNFLLNKLTELGEWVSLARANAKFWEELGRPMEWAILISSSQETYVIIPIEKFKELHELRIKYPTYDGPVPE